MMRKMKAPRPYKAAKKTWLGKCKGNNGEVVVRKRDGPWEKYRKKLRKYLHREEKVN